MTKAAPYAAKILSIILLFSSVSGAAFAHEEGTPSGGEEGEVDVDEIGEALSNPVSDIWALFTEFDLIFSDGDVNRGDAKVGSAMLFQPIMPLPLWRDWKLIVRPTIPVVWSASVPQGFNSFDRKTGLGDSLLPLIVAPPLENWIVALGPAFTLPTSTKDALGRQQWAMGPAGVLGYKTEDFILGVFPQYFWGIGSRGDQGSKPDASYMSLLYFGWLNLPDAWQIGFNPVITYDNKASSGNRWNVPVGLVATKTVMLGRMPVKFQFGAEYSVVSQDDFGKRAMFKLNIIPVMPSLIQRPIFGGG
jgi:hypothetical protein